MFNIISLVAVGAGAAGLLHGIYRLLMRRKPPKFIVPLSAGLAMIVFHIWNEYSWYGRTADMLPPSIEIVDTLSVKEFWAPWTYIFPKTNGFVALDRASTQQNAKLPGFVMATTMFVKRAEDTLITHIIINCAERRWMAIFEGTNFDENGLPLSPEWAPFESNTHMAEAACK